MSKLSGVGNLLRDADTFLIPQSFIAISTAIYTAAGLAYIATFNILIVTFFWIIQLCLTLSLHRKVAKAGACGAQEHGELIIERVEGSFSNVMGLPIERLRATFEKLGMLGTTD